ncbi:MAG: UDP-N-acetylmuramoyl-L-alanyl-D-glutamate--2,6-diaminopimelate ligase [Gammaproteobacteria bacterium]|jgi:UDP-N-acetylmuramoyl-L-alanyl-D-glutamate--2,6-diaminopimelate ligase
MMPAIHQPCGTTLHDLLHGLLDASSLSAVAGVVVDGIAQDSREVGANYLFIAVGGTTSHGLHYVEQAIAAGARVVLCDDAVDGCKMMLGSVADKVLCVQLKGLQQNIGKIASRFFHHPSHDLNLIGVTGTDGKTSVSHYIAQCLNSSASPCGVLGTLGNGLLDDLRPTGLTTASAVELQSSLAELVTEGAKAAAIEVSSHGLDQGRANGIEFDTAVFTNLSQDHLDYHGSMDAYFEAKSKLFATEGLKSAVINLDDAFGCRLAQRYRYELAVLGYSISSDVDKLVSCTEHYLHAKSIKPTRHGFDIRVATAEGEGDFTLNLLGDFNISNALAALATLLLNNIALQEALTRLEAIRPVPGRMELIETKNRPTVIVDYAHTPQGVAAACKAAKQHFNGQLWCVFGCGGDRDRDKRPLMAMAAEKYADRVIVTSDNPRYEDPQTIIQQIVAGFAHPEAVACYIDRRDAMLHAITQAATEDVVLIVGKGHESVQIIADERVDFDDRVVARELLENGAVGVGI